MSNKFPWLKKPALIFLSTLLIAVIGFVIYLKCLALANDTSCIFAPEIQFTSELEIADQLQSVLDQYSQAHGNVGLQVTVILPDGAQWSGVSGYANDAKACPLTLDHHLYIGSITKTFTAALVMQQIEIGTLNLDETIADWISHPAVNRITVKMLLNHTSGLPSYTEDTFFLLAYFGRPQKQWTPGELFTFVQDKPLKFEPGSRHKYSNTNFLVLGMILEQVTGKKYGELLEETAAEIGLERIYYPGFLQNLPLANGYDETIFNLGKRNLTAFRLSMVSGGFSAGGIATSSDKTAIFFHTLFGKEWLSAETVEQMMNTIDAPDEDVPLQKGYGLGVRNLIINGETLYGHTGTIPGYSGIAMHNPKYGFTVVILSNVSTIEQTTIFADLQNVMIQYLER